MKTRTSRHGSFCSYRAAAKSTVADDDSEAGDSRSTTSRVLGKKDVSMGQYHDLTDRLDSIESAVGFVVARVRSHGFDVMKFDLDRFRWMM